jgi:hypothetical protein
MPFLITSVFDFELSAGGGIKTHALYPARALVPQTYGSQIENNSYKLSFKHNRTMEYRQFDLNGNPVKLKKHEKIEIELNKPRQRSREEEMRTRILLSLQGGLLDEVPCALRAVTVGWEAPWIYMHSYFDGEISDENFDSLGAAAAEVIADFLEPWKIDDKCFRKDAPESLGPYKLMEWVYHRYEDNFNMAHLYGQYPPKRDKCWEPRDMVNLGICVRLSLQSALLGKVPCFLHKIETGFDSTEIVINCIFDEVTTRDRILMETVARDVSVDFPEHKVSVVCLNKDSSEEKQELEKRYIVYARQRDWSAKKT